MELELNSFNYKSRKSKRLKYFFTILLISISLLTTLSWYFFVSLSQAPENFPADVPITIPEGASARKATEILSQSGYVRSELVLYFSLLLWHDPSSIKASTYVFSEPLSTREIANEITKGRFSDDLVKLTHIEGERASTLAKRAEKVLPEFNASEFLTLATPVEGTLFPDTYLLPNEYTAEELFTLLTDTFNQKIAPLQEKINSNKLSLSEIITLASIVEREANTVESKKLVAGILLKRLSMNMPLQADASIEYVLNKPLKELTAEDLKVESPYNTYLNLGLPPTPIGNPGLDAITAVLEPTPSNYLFYITGNDGEFYYAKDFDAHKVNIAKYLR